ncbi:diiron oxygenase [Chromohalobacter canadensis]|uniref:diiron oxygenase n=1 Tax=Chromohalobacter canadensis TaxID=141389 RepID=UPI00240FF78E|nr:diiron oxygenase [Chromohalobacter canadensis]
MYTGTDSPMTARENEILARLTESWNQRVAVRKARLDLNDYYDTTAPDFPPSMVPFWNDPRFQAIDETKKRRVLAGAWINYNEKTICVEDKVINPMCSLLLRDALPGVGDSVTKKAIAQTQVDEQFHILMCLEVCDCARRQHQLHDLHIPTPLLEQRMETALSKADNEREFALIRMAYATVAEMTINVFLKRLSQDRGIQPLNRLNTELHRQDEASHAAIFGEIARAVYERLGTGQQAIFRAHLMRAIDDFIELDVGFWRAILDYLAIPERESILQDMASKSRTNRSLRDYSALVKLLRQIGIHEGSSFVFQ